MACIKHNALQNNQKTPTNKKTAAKKKKSNSVDGLIPKPILEQSREMCGSVFTSETWKIRPQAH